MEEKERNVLWLKNHFPDDSIYEFTEICLAMCEKILRKYVEDQDFMERAEFIADVRLAMRSFECK